MDMELKHGILIALVTVAVSAFVSYYISKKQTDSIINGYKDEVKKLIK